MSYIFFWKPSETDGYLGNWYTSPLKKDNINYSCVEQYIMAMKAKLFGDNTMLSKIMSTKDPNLHRNFGRLVKDFDEDVWNEHKEDVLYDGLYAKFTQNSNLKDKLLKTGDKILVEASPYDKIYGIGMKKDHPDINNPRKWKGENLLGNTLMRVRKDLQ